ncbi:MAG: nitroreductase [Oscillospiraceae bacterium]|jgi:nitroreductase|nr:nitroreductase [Oscillospiraceae bacterium]
MNEIIRKRKSIRKYDFTPLDADTLEKLQEQIKRVKPLYPDIGYSIEIVNKTKGIFNIKAPYYLVFGSEEKEGAYENIGFIGQQLDLYLSGAGLGTCWLGASKPTKKEASALPSVICMSFGKPVGPLYRKLSEFKRKPLSAISEGNDERLESARLAPSAVNAQNWYFIAKSGKIHCYRTKTKSLLKSMFDKMHCIDMGIALCHIAEESKEFHFTKEADAPSHSGSIYMGTIR